VGLGVVGLEPNRLAECGDCLGQLALAAQGVAEIHLGHGVVGLEPKSLAQRAHGLRECHIGLVAVSSLLEQTRPAAPVPAVLGP
jgi:hypothetical protein